MESDNQQGKAQETCESDDLRKVTQEAAKVIRVEPWRDNPKDALAFTLLVVILAIPVGMEYLIYMFFIASDGTGWLVPSLSLLFFCTLAWLARQQWKNCHSALRQAGLVIIVAILFPLLTMFTYAQLSNFFDLPVIH